ncbi:DUF3817 domain-containing protein [Pelagibius sp. Alg239-R121]|uniref:DUF3817 domain-containing protein n=1 Tax=Pelagibius sp. Alg239-R121 TaxID=2993448 RepID=UPI0024A671A1|nr:DUF3817 domain-containing protein [Pelagibius sp. Alg239-R121]
MRYPDAASIEAARTQMRWMRFVSLLEGTTLVALVFIAVPLKHFAGFPAATSVMGPVHGFAFLLYIWMLAQAASSFAWPKSDIIPLFVMGFIPFGAFVNERRLKRIETDLTLSR